MTARERVLCAIAHKRPDRIPADLMLEGATVGRLLREYSLSNEEELYDRFASDLQFVFPSTSFVPEFLPDGSWYDRMGLHMHTVSNGYAAYGETASNPLADCETVDEILSYPRFPTTADLDFSVLAREAKRISAKRAVKLHTGGIFEIARDLRGYEQFLCDMITDPDLVHAIMGRLCDYWCDYVEKSMEAAGDFIDIVYTYDDIATQQSLLISPAMLQEFVYPYHRRLNTVIKAYGKPILFHSCGAVLGEIGALADLPIDILTPLQPRAAGMDHAAVKAQFGERLAFHGAIDIQETLPNGTPDAVRAAVRHAIETLGGDGGYILCAAHYIQNDTPTENIEAMYDIALRTV